MANQKPRKLDRLEVGQPTRWWAREVPRLATPIAAVAVVALIAFCNNVFAKPLEPSNAQPAPAGTKAGVDAARQIPNTTFVTPQTFEQEVTKSKGTVLVYFGGATWCPPCQAMKPTIHELAANAGSKYRMLNVDTLRDGADGAWRKQLRERYGFAGIPTLMMVKDGKPVSIQTGMQDKATTQQWLDNALKATLPLPTPGKPRPAVPGASSAPAA